MNTVHRIGRSERRSSSRSGSYRGSVSSPGLVTMVTDVVLAAAWAAMIPGLLWLGVAGGF
ncbi:MAG: hypothetical protein KA735_01540 [Burkholderiaceae bacterium]|nr:hypothetical protein [Burkholderiaceae bacterium]